MLGDKSYIAEVIEEMTVLVSEQIGDRFNVFSEHRPTTAPSQMKEFAVVSLPVQIRDSNVQKRTIMRIEIHVKNKASGISNTARLDEIANIILGMFPISTKRFSALSPVIVLRGDNGTGFTAWFINCDLRINSTDRYNTI